MLSLDTPVYTHIHGAWYDLSRWGPSHPGGPIALSLAHGRDGTVLFEQSHPFTSREYMLGLMAGFRVSPQLSAELHARYPKVAGEASCFTFSQGLTAAVEGGGVRGSSSSSSSSCTKRRPRQASPPPTAHSSSGSGSGSASTSPSTSRGPTLDAFEADVKGVVRGYFEEEAARRGVSLREATKAPPERWLSVGALGVGFLALGALPLVRGEWWALATAPILCWVFMVNFWHDASHFAMSTNWVVNWALLYCAPWFSSPLVWWHQHVIGHHSYTNIPGKDPDLYHAPSLWRFSKDVRWRASHAWQQWSTLFLWALSVPTLLLLKPIMLLKTGAMNRVVPIMHLSTARVIGHLLGRLVVIFTLYVWPVLAFGATFKALAFGTLPITIFSLLFMACSQVNHHSEETSAAGPLATAAHPVNWYRHQAATSHTIAPHSSFAFWASGGLNLQLEHHLFPAINHWHLPHLAPLIEAAAARHGVPYPKSTRIGEAFRKLFVHLASMALKPLTTGMGGGGVGGRGRGRGGEGEGVGRSRSSSSSSSGGSTSSSSRSGGGNDASVSSDDEGGGSGSGSGSGSGRGSREGSACKRRASSRGRVRV